MNSAEKLHAFIKANGLHFNDIQLLATSLTHPSYAQEHDNIDNNQRLEFLGDSVLNMVVAQYLFENYPEKAEGILTKIRSKVVCEKYLAKYAKDIAIGDVLILGRGEDNSGGRSRNSILADAVEALIGAIYMDQGLEAAQEFILRHLSNDIEQTANGDFYDFKSRLQELVQSTSRENVTYEILQETGPAHNRTFVAGVYYKDRLLASGEGKTKKEAEQRAAEKALKETFA